MIIDISPLVSPRIGVWPGDVAFRRSVTCSIAGGANIDLSSFESTVHLGAHTDAPSHYRGGAETIDERPLDLYYGPCQVIEVAVGRGERIGVDHVREPIVAPRVLFHTGTYPDPDHFSTDFASLSAPLVRWLASQGVRLVGIDTPSVDLFDDKVLESHQAVAAADMAILEGVVLDHVVPGLYTLVALPLKLEGSDASPVRAALVR